MLDSPLIKVDQNRNDGSTDINVQMNENLTPKTVPNDATNTDDY